MPIAPPTPGPLAFFVTNGYWFPKIRAAKSKDRGDAWALMTYCAEQRNGGFIADCKGWSAGKWEKMAGISGKPREKSDFFRWENNGLRVLCYDAERDAKALRTSQTRKDAAHKRWRKKKDANADTNADAEKRRNTTFTGSISKAGPSAEAMGPGFDGAAHAAGGELAADDNEPVTNEDIDAFRPETLV